MQLKNRIIVPSQVVKSLVMIIGKDKVVTFRYKLNIVDSQCSAPVETVPLTTMKILIGRGNLLEPFEKHIEGLTRGDLFRFTLKSEDAYGVYQSKAVVMIEKSVFHDDNEEDRLILEVGNYIPMENNDNLPFNGKILEINDDTVKIDFNHPLAGKDLHFEGEIIDIREATPKEMLTGQVNRKIKKSNQ